MHTVFRIVIAPIIAIVAAGCSTDAKSQSPSESDLEAVHCAAVLAYFQEASKRMKYDDTTAKQELETGAEKALRKFHSLHFEGKDEHFLQSVAEIEQNPSKFKRYAYYCMTLDK